MANEHIEKLIHNLLNVDDFPLVPHLDNPDKDLKYNFDFFSNLSGDIIARELILSHHNHTKFEQALNIIAHYKDGIKFFDSSIDFEVYKKVKPHLDDGSKNKFREEFYKQYANRVIDDLDTDMDNELIDFIYDKDLNLYIEIAKKLNIVEAVNKIYSKNPEKVFGWLNSSKNMYVELVKLRQPQFIFNNMNGQLEINDDSLKYFFEIAPVDINIYKEVKKTLGLETIWKYTHHKISPEFYSELVENFDEFKFLITLPNLKINSLEQILKNLKTKFPHIYDNFQSLMLLKNDFHNK